jgi:hypothetical protein
MWKYLSQHIRGLSAPQHVMAQQAGLENPKYSGPSVFRVMKRHGLCKNSSIGKVFTYWATGNPENINWTAYAKDKQIALDSLEELRILWKLPESELPQTLHKYFHADDSADEPQEPLPITQPATSEIGSSNNLVLVPDEKLHGVWWNKNTSEADRKILNKFYEEKRNG